MIGGLRARSGVATDYWILNVMWWLWIHGGDGLGLGSDGFPTGDWLDMGRGEWDELDVLIE